MLFGIFYATAIGREANSTSQANNYKWF